MTSPAEELRRAAQHIRSVAGKATRGPWLNLDRGDRIIRHPDATAAEDRSDPCGAGPPLEYVVDEPLYANRDNGEHIALWDPPTALFVADLFAEEAEDMDRTAKESIYGENAVRFVYDIAGDVAPILMLARAINAKSAAEAPEGTQP